ncbi:biopolymer transporter ExbD [Candidatus Aerophobetes bacterium]|nr:biopolymer transporter ExbD [Candidatus Aerophobetes bacterium]
MRPLIRKKIPLSLEIAPLIDIVFLLLVFFLLTSIGSQNITQLDLPESSTAKQEQESLSICITKEGKVFVNERRVEMESLLPFLRSILEERKNKTVNIKADANTPFRIPVRVMDICRKAGATMVSIATQEEKRR